MTRNSGVKIKRVLNACMGLLSRRLKILAWHSIAPRSRDPFEVDVGMFQRQMKLLAEEGYSVRSLEQAVHDLQSGEISAKTVVITFDDGFKKLQDHAFPLLEQYRFSATVFMPFDYVGGIDSFSYKNPRPDFEILSLDEMKDSRQRGISYGSHTMSHADLTRLSDEQLVYELKESRNVLNDTLNIKFSSLAYPFGLFDERVKQAVTAVGYDCALCFGNVLSNSKYTWMNELKREKILASTDLDEFRKLIDSKNDFSRKVRSNWAHSRYQSKFYEFWTQ